MHDGHTERHSNHWSVYIAIAGLAIGMIIDIGIYIYCLRNRYRSVGRLCCLKRQGFEKTPDSPVVGLNAAAPSLGSPTSNVGPQKEEVEYIALYPKLTKPVA